MNKQETNNLHQSIQTVLQEEVRNKLFVIRNEQVIIDADLAALYGVETRVLNQAVKRNKERFPDNYMFQLSQEEFEILKSQSVTSSWGGTRKLPFAFTERGLYMLATILRSENATAATFAIIETFASVRELKRELVNLHKETDTKVQQSKMKRFGEVLSELVMPELETSETESTLELNFIIGKIKHTVKRTKINPKQGE